MIPKVIHYCWFGRGEKSKLIQKCIKSWKKYCPDYEIIEWNEDNFDINCNKFVEQAYECKKWAFVSDYARLFILYNYGGIYMDTDVELVKPLDGFLCNKAFSGFEKKTVIPTGIMASEKEFQLFEYLLQYYDERAFIKSDGDLDTETNVSIITKMLGARGFVPNGEYQVIDGFAVYPVEYFCPLQQSTGKLNKTHNTVAIHWFNSSWRPLSERVRMGITRPFHRIFGEQCFHWILKLFKISFD